MLIFVIMRVMMFMLVPMGMFRCVLPPGVWFSRRILFAVSPHIHFRSGDAAPHNPGEFQTRFYSQRGHGMLEHLRRNSGIDQRA